MPTPPRTSCFRTRTHLAAVLAAGVAIGLGGVTPAPAQPISPDKQPGKPVRRGRIVKQPIVDLAKQASERRPGQVLPGDPPPDKFAAPMSEPKSAPAPETASAKPASSPTVKPAAVPVNPDAGPRPLPTTTEKPTAPDQPAPEQKKTEDPKPAEPAPTAPAEPTKPSAVIPTEAVPQLSMLREPRPRGSANATPPGQPTTISVAQVEGDPNGVQWRSLNDASAPWQTISSQDRADGRFEIRTGLDTQTTLNLPDGASVRIGRLSRVTIEQAANSNVPAVTVSRGSVEVRPGTAELASQAMVRCPDRADGFVSPPGSRVTYSAFRGTQVRSAALTGIGD